MLSFNDIFKKSFLQGFEQSDIGMIMVFTILVITAIISIYIFIVYKTITRKTFYSKTFNISLVGVAMITAAIIITIQSSIVVSLGMVGALSIVRFRTAIKDPIDLMFLFWSISTGIICGAGFAQYAVILAVLLTVVIVVLDKMPISKTPLVLIVNSNDSGLEDEIISFVKKHSKYFDIKSRNISANSFDLVVELRTSEGKELVESISKINGINSVSLLNHDGEITF